MTRSKGLTSHYPLKMRPDERAIVERVQAFGQDAGLTVSLNDAIRHLVRRAEIAVPRSYSEGIAAMQEHAESCAECQPYQPPHCLDGLYLRELNRQTVARVQLAAS